jgi:hypothetical protein
VLRQVCRRLRGIPLEFHGVPKLARVWHSRAQSAPPNKANRCRGFHPAINPV